MKQIKADASQRDIETLLSHLRLRLPQPARMRPILMARLRARTQTVRLSPNCLVTGVFQAGQEARTFCQLQFGAGQEAARVVAPLEQISFTGQNRAIRDIVALLTDNAESRRVQWLEELAEHSGRGHRNSRARHAGE